MSAPFFRDKVERFLGENGLRLEAVDSYYVIEDSDGRILAGAGLQGDVIKCVAVAADARSEGLAAPLLSEVISRASARGITCLKVFTKPENEGIFQSLGFHVLARAPQALLMENGRGLERYCSYLKGFAREGRNGVVVMNANPFTLGHKYLIDKALEQVDHLFVIPVKEDVSRFPYAERIAMIRLASACPTAGEKYFSGRRPKNQFSPAIATPTHADASAMHDADEDARVIVLVGSDYQISALTFPTYFLKDLSDAAETQMRLDIDLFARWIAPALGATVRFVGSEPLDSLTARYNALLHELLPGVVEIPRLSLAPAGPTAGDNYLSGRCPKNQFPPAIATPTHADASFMPGPDRASRPVSASAVREALDRGRFREAAALTPETTWPYLLADLAERALRMELDTPLKPGLVGPDSNGAHQDMDYALMLKGIAAIRPFFPRMVMADTPEALRQLGIDAEKAMLEATGGVNTHRGAIFCLGLALNTVGREMEVADNKDLMQKDLAKNAGVILHNYLIDNKIQLTGSSQKGAREMALGGYRELFEDWLPYYRSVIPSEARESHLLLLLLRIMSTLDDTCVIKRVGYDRAQEVKREAFEILRSAQNDRTGVQNDRTGLQNDNCHPEEPQATKDLRILCERYAAEGISPGGAADMLALTIFTDSIL